MSQTIFKFTFEYGLIISSQRGVVEDRSIYNRYNTKQIGCIMYIGTACETNTNLIPAELPG